MIKQICTKCNGAGEITRAAVNMSPACNISMCHAVTIDNNQRRGFSVGIMPVGNITHWHHPCTCKDGFVEWTRGESLTPNPYTGE